MAAAAVLGVRSNTKSWPPGAHRPAWWRLAAAAGLTAILALVLLTGLDAAPAAAAPSSAAPERTFSDVSPFIDVNTDDDNYDAIYFLWYYDVILGYEIDGGVYEFRPYNPVLRQHFAKMIVLSLDVPVSEDDVCIFEDVDDSGAFGDYYPDNYIAAAYNAGITYGTSDYTFDPWGEITRAQLITMVVRAIQDYYGAYLEEPDWDVYGGFMTDFDDPDHGYNAQLAEWNGLLVGLDLYGWDPWDYASRGEVAQILYNTMIYLN